MQLLLNESLCFMRKTDYVEGHKKAEEARGLDPLSAKAAFLSGRALLRLACDPSSGAVDRALAQKCISALSRAKELSPTSEEIAKELDMAKRKLSKSLE